MSTKGFTLVILLTCIGFLVGGFVLASILSRSKNEHKTSETSNRPSLVESTISSSLSDRLTQLEGEIKSNKLDKSLADRLSSLEEQFKQINTKSPSTAVNIPVIYIPIGSTNDTVTSTDWANFGQLIFSIDPVDYPGVKSMQLIGDLRVNAGGIVHARLYNDSDQKAIQNSEISTSQTTFSSLTSSNFTLPNSKKTYRIQGKSDAGDQIFLQNVKIKVSF